MPAGRAPERSVIERSCTSCCVNRPLNVALCRLIGSWMATDFRTLLSRHYRELIASTCAEVKRIELAPAFSSKDESNLRLAIFILTVVRLFEDRDPVTADARVDQVPLLAAIAVVPRSVFCPASGPHPGGNTPLFSCSAAS